VKAVLLAAGLGTRLAPLTDTIPKILAPVAGRPLLEHQLAYLERYGVKEVAINLHHHADRVLEFLEVRPPGVRVWPYQEPELLGTAGALIAMRGFLDEPFVLLYGDVLTNADLRDLQAAHARTNAAATICYHVPESTEGKGVMAVDSDGRVRSFVEKPSGGAGAAPVNAGLHVLHPLTLGYVERGSDFGRDVWPAMIRAGEDLRAYDLGTAYVRDLGAPDALAAAGADLTAGVV